MSLTRVLLIGGPCAGWKEIELGDHDTTLLLPYIGPAETIPIDGYSGSDADVIKVQFLTYTRQQFRGSDKIFIYFQCEGMTADQVVETLFECYGQAHQSQQVDTLVSDVLKQRQRAKKRIQKTRKEIEDGALPRKGRFRL